MRGGKTVERIRATQEQLSETADAVAASANTPETGKATANTRRRAHRDVEKLIEHPPAEDKRKPGRKRPGRHPVQALKGITLASRLPVGKHADGNGLYVTVDPSGAKRWSWRGTV